ncbi:MAG: PD-(D/E)XK nuclease family protein [Planctomycetales bacterium]|nr:PD-(D/E)XK nuclease family protein [Planctomycetales bacterium]MBN8626043.1 PD-(D/E)XK nuclease family protein [Planctomycetota bacterium]
MMQNSTALLRSLAGLSGSPVLKQIEKRCRRLNIFDVLGVARYELSHSNFLAWLLSPSETHDCGAFFIEKLLDDLASVQPVASEFCNVVGTSSKPSSIDVRREWMNIDLLVLFHETKCVVAIENKIDSAEHDDQLNRYYNIVQSHFPAYQQLYVYLTWEGEPASDARWMSYSYRQLHYLLRLHLETISNANADVVVFLKQYMDLLGRHFMRDSEVEEMCRQIYRQHQQALDLIYDCVKADHTRPLEVLGQELRNRPNRWHVFQAGKSLIAASPMAWLSQLPAWIEESGRDPRSWVSLWINRAMDDINLTIYVSHGDKNLRQEVLQKLAASFQKLGKTPPKSKARDGAYVYVEKLFCIGDQAEIDEVSVRRTVKKVVDELERWTSQVQLV